MPPTSQLISMFGLMLLSGFFSGSETALFYLNREEIRRFRKGRSSERAAASLLDRPNRLLIAVLFWNLVVNLSYFSLASVITIRLGEDYGATSASAFGLITLAILVIFGEVIPKSVAVTLRRPIARLVSFPVYWSVRIVDGIIPLMNVVTVLLRRLFWPSMRTESYLSPEDLERAVSLSSTDKTLNTEEQRLIDTVLDLSDIQAHEWMRPRSQIRWFQPPVHLDQVIDDCRDMDYVLITEEDNEEITTAVSISGLREIPTRHLEHYAEEVVYVPWSASLAGVLGEMRHRVSNVAVVVNEYGETQGVLTYEDLLDGIFRKGGTRTGRLLGRPPIRRIDNEVFHVEGITALRVMAAYFNIPFHPGRSASIAGYLQEQLGRVPEVGDTARWEHLQIHVVEKKETSRLLLELRTAIPPQAVPRPSNGNDPKQQVRGDE